MLQLSVESFTSVASSVQEKFADGQGDSYIPLKKTFVCWGYNNSEIVFIIVYVTAMVQMY